MIYRHWSSHKTWIVESFRQGICDMTMVYMRNHCNWTENIQNVHVKESYWQKIPQKVAFYHLLQGKQKIERKNECIHCLHYIIVLNVHLCALTISIWNKLHAASINPRYDFPFCFHRFSCALSAYAMFCQRKTLECIRQSPAWHSLSLSLSLSVLCIYLSWVTCVCVYVSVLLWESLFLQLHGEHLTFNFGVCTRSHINWWYTCLAQQNVYIKSATKSTCIEKMI